MSRKIVKRCILFLLGTLFLWVVALLIYWFGPDFRGNDPSEPRITLAFDPKKVGETYSFDVNLLGPVTCDLSLRFYIVALNKWSYLLDKSPGPQEEDRFYKIVGNEELNNDNEPRMPVKLRVQLMQQEDKTVLLDEVVTYPESSSGYMGRYSTLFKKTLQAGRYTIRIDYLEGAPELAPFPAEIWFTRAYTGK